MIWRYQPDKWLISPISAKILVDMWDLDVFAGSGAGCRNLCSGLIFASSIESPKSPNASKFIAPPPPHECAEWGGGARLPRRCGRARFSGHYSADL